MPAIGSTLHLVISLGSWVTWVLFPAEQIAVKARVHCLCCFFSVSVYLWAVGAVERVDLRDEFGTRMLFLLSSREVRVLVGCSVAWEFERW